MDVPGTLVQEVMGVQLRVEPEQVVVHIVVACAGGVIPVEAASATTATRPARIKSLLILFLLSEETQCRHPCHGLSCIFLLNP
jgi:hypothetical protein